GLTVVPHYGMLGGRRVPLALGHPDLPGELLLAVVTDDDRYVAEASLRRRERHWRQRLEGAGWHVHTVFSTALFLDPQREADNILSVVLDILATRQRGSHEASHA